MRSPVLSRAALCAAALMMASPSMAQQTAQDQQVTSPSYADLADVAAAAPIAADVRLRRATRLRGELAAGVPPGMTRHLIEADVLSLLRGAQGLPGRISWLYDLPDVAPNRPARIPRKARWLFLGDTVPGRPGQVRLAGPNALIPWTAEMDQRLRALLVELAAPNAAPPVTGVGNAFHVPGAIPGESETQIFLTTGDGRPVSLSILRRPGEQPRWAVALGEMVDDSAEPPQPQTLLWYRLACFLPRELPAGTTADMDEAAAAATREDYALVIAGLGACARTPSG